MQISSINSVNQSFGRKIIVNPAVLNSEETAIMQPILSMVRDGLIDDELLRLLRKKYPNLSTLSYKITNGATNPAQESFNKININV